MMMKKLTQKMASSNTSPVHLLALMIVSGLYGISVICVGVGIGILLLLLIVGDLDISNARLLALGILLYFPLRYLKMRLEK